MFEGSSTNLQSGSSAGGYSNPDLSVGYGGPTLKSSPVSNFVEDKLNEREYFLVFSVVGLILLVMGLVGWIYFTSQKNKYKKAINFNSRSAQRIL